MGEWISKLWEAIKEVANTPTMVQASPGVATSYATTGQYMPRVQSTVGDEVGYLVDVVSAPTQPSDIKAIYQIARHPVQSTRTAKKAVEEGVGYIKKKLLPKKQTPKVDYTKNILDYLGTHKDNTNLGKFDSNQMEYIDYLKKLGVDVSKLSSRDITKIQSDRFQVVSNSIPTQGMSAVVHSRKPGPNSPLYIELDGYINGQDRGAVFATQYSKDPYFRISNISDNPLYNQENLVKILIMF